MGSTGRYAPWKRVPIARQGLVTPCRSRSFSCHEESAAIDTTHRINDQIRLSPVRVVDQEGKMLGVIPTSEAMRLAYESGLDLVEVAPNERPPVCRIMDYGKFKYEQKKKHSNSTKQHQVQLKEIRLRPKTGDHDIDFKIKQARVFLAEKDKVKLNVIFRGRENAHHERGREMLAEIIQQLQDVGKVEKMPSLEGGRNMIAIIAPKT
jgi:translation initiation factor IF-3